MANQPASGMPGQSNAAGSGGQNYQNNTIEGAGYGQSFFGGAPKGGQGSGMGGGLMISDAATSLLGSQFQGQAPGFFGAQGQQGQQAPPAGGGQGGMQSGGPGSASLTPPPDQQGPNYATLEPGGKPVINFRRVNSGGSYGSGYQILYSDGTMETVYPYSDPAKYGQASQLEQRLGGSPGEFDTSRGENFLGDRFAFVDTYDSPYAEDIRRMQGVDPTASLRQTLASQLGALQQQRGTAVQQATARQRGLGFSGAGGLDLAGLGADFARTAGNINLQGQQAMDAAQQAYDEELSALQKTQTADLEARIQTNMNSVQTALDDLYRNAANQAAQGLFVGVNPQLVQQLNELKTMAATRPVSTTELAVLIQDIVGSYGPKTYVEADKVEQSLF